jgi:putative membrane-bound dehydrogenase-like protein
MTLARADDRPQLLDPRLTLELVAEQPDIVTPTGVAVDTKGRIFAIENNTHQRTPDYQGPPTDRVRVFKDFDAVGKAQKNTTFAEGFKDSMALTFGPDGVLYLATRSQIYQLRDSGKNSIVRLETKGSYPHNGLCGFAWDTNGDLIFGLGENLGEAYKLIGSDGSTLSGGGEGGNVYRCRPDGSKVSRISTGFWNPWGMTVDARGRLFVVDNDPDARGPCRLLHAVQGGDFGYRFRYGRSGNHPFQCWNGELPGTLPMVAGTSEAPSGIVPCDFTSMSGLFPGELLVTSWGDHTIERFHLEPRGASVSATSKIVIRGGENFRPVALAIAPDGSVVFTDWVDKSYPVHGKGRIWRLRAKPEFGGKPKAAAAPPPTRGETDWFAIAMKPPSPAARMDAILHLRSPDHLKEIVAVLGDADPFLAGAALDVLGRPGILPILREALAAKPGAALRTGILLALRKTGEPDARRSLIQFLSDPDPGVRRAAIQWVAEERLTEFAGKLESAASTAPATRELFEAWLAARELLDGKKPTNPGKTIPGEEYVAAILKDPGKPVLFRTLAVRLLRPDHPLLSPARLADLLKEPDADLKREVVRALVMRPDGGAQALLRKVAVDETMGIPLRALAISGLAQTAETKATGAVLAKTRTVPELQSESLRSLGERPPLPKRTAAEWRRVVATESGDPAAGERVFFHAKGPGCSKCHMVDNRGSGVGPDLSTIGRATPREKLIESILDPSKEIAPAYTAWRITTRDGKDRIGLIAGETFDSFVTVVDSQGKVEKIRRTDIEDRVAQTKSIMPDDLANQMTEREFRDLIAFLSSRK